MSVAFQHRSFVDEDPYARIGKDDHDNHDDDHEMNQYINADTEANVDDMHELAAATYIHEDHDLSVSREASCQHDDDGAPSPFKITESSPEHHDLDQTPPPNVDPSKVPLDRALSPPRLHSGAYLIDGGGVTMDSRPQFPPTPRSKAIEKPNRIDTKNADGKYICTHPNCKGDSKSWKRRCEWNKHMDKHERPYVCTVTGCEKVLGFTYSGGLLRHEREVHNKHGGPKKALYCPHGNCKRHKGKGFSRLENLQEHLRRVHTSNSSTTTTLIPSDDGIADGATAAILHQHHSPMSDSVSDVASAAFAVMTGMDATPGDTAGFGDVAIDAAAADYGAKRKRSLEDEGHRETMRIAMMEENATLRQENATLGQENAALGQENNDLRRQCQELRSQLEAYQAQIHGAVQAAINAQAAISALAVPPPPPPVL